MQPLEVRRSIYQKRLRLALRSMPEDCFLGLMWGVDALQSDRSEQARLAISFPSEAIGATKQNPYAIHKWELETIILMYLMTEPRFHDRAGYALLDCSDFYSASELVNYLRQLEEIEAEIYLQEIDVFMELHRIAQRQFAWQRGFFHKIDLYRSAYLYGGGKSGDYFFEKNGISVQNLFLLCFSMYSTFLNFPIARELPHLHELGISESVVAHAAPLICEHLDSARVRIKFECSRLHTKYASGLPVAFIPSIIRERPILYKDGFYYCPVPELIGLRATAGLYYDVVGGGASIINDVNLRFEDYCADLVQKCFADVELRRASKYKFSGRSLDTIDLDIARGGNCLIAVECKATKLTINAQYSENPFEDAASGYMQMAKAVYQLWRYFAHLRKGVISGRYITEISCGIVLTMDSWLLVSGELQSKVVSQARSLIRSDDGITESDMRPFVFCQIRDFESIVMLYKLEDIIDGIHSAQLSEFRGWELAALLRKAADKSIDGAKFPFSMDEVLPWWRMLKSAQSRS